MNYILKIYVLSRVDAGAQLGGSNPIEFGVCMYTFNKNSIYKIYYSSIFARAHYANI